ncbi:hypothetical protein F4806DRAFT_493190 [Annulohypoxylon nitens]|nr:hypothetical protein F4806DRAFT_493190 [Annulohypoxylon nitens]
MESNSLVLYSQPNPTRFIPIEILILIIEHLRLPVYQVTDEAPPKGFLETRNTLYNLCLTAKFLLGYVRPLLYETIILYLDSKKTHNFRVGHQRSLVRLIRTLVEDSDRFCPLIKNIILPSIISDHLWISPYHEYSIDVLRWPFAAYDYPS